MRVFVLAIFLMPLLLSSCGSKSRANRKIPLKILEADISQEVDSTRFNSVDRIHKEE